MIARQTHERNYRGKNDRASKKITVTGEIASLFFAHWGIGIAIRNLIGKH